MGLLSLLKSKFSSPAAPASGGGDDVERARTRARQRLIGAVVLVGAGIIGFPLLFETHPRPIPVDIPIEITNKEKASALPMPPARPTAAARAAAASRAAPPEMITESAGDAGRELPPPVETPPEAPVKPPVTAADTRKPEKVEKPDKPAAVATAKPATPAGPPKPAAAPASSPADAARARALLDGKDGNKPVAKADDAASASSARFVVQVGAFAEATAARETRQKVEKLGLKTYTQVVDTSAGSRIRVRVGPFVSREEADRAAGKLKSAGLSAALLSL